jgi:hypothetical protein
MRQKIKSHKKRIPNLNFAYFKMGIRQTFATKNLRLPNPPISDFDIVTSLIF